MGKRKRPSDSELIAEDTGVKDLRSLTGNGTEPIEALYWKLSRDGRSNWLKVVVSVIVTLLLFAGTVVWSMGRTTEEVENLGEDVREHSGVLRETEKAVTKNTTSINGLRRDVKRLEDTQ